MIELNEIFYTIQSEGIYSGKPAVFLRTVYCPVHCSWCDTKHTWAKLDNKRVSQDDVIAKTIKDIDKRWAMFTNADILKYCKDFDAKLVVITGGEPCTQDLTSLTKELHDNGIHSQIETSGTQPILTDPRTSVCVSPKIDVGNKNIQVLKEAWERADFLKMVITDEASLSNFDRYLAEYGKPQNSAIYLQPESMNPKATDLCIEICKERNWNLSIQYHKYISIR